MQPADSFVHTHFAALREQNRFLRTTMHELIAASRELQQQARNAQDRALAVRSTSALLCAGMRRKA